MKKVNEAEYTKMVCLTYSNFNFELTEYESKLLKIFFLRSLQKFNLRIYFFKNLFRTVQFRKV